MTTLSTQSIPFARPWITAEDKEAVLQVLEGHILTHGPRCKEFEAEFAAFLGEDAYAVTVSSCMAALHLAYLHFGIGTGDEVIVPAQTHTATVHAVEWVGATPVFVDCEPETGNMSPEAIAAAITPRTRAISVVHFVGIPCNMPAIIRLAEAHHLKVIEDCALAVGSRFDGRHVGLFGDAGCFSFYPVKHMTTGEGGMFVTRHPDVATAVARLRAFGVDRTHTERSIPGMYDVPGLGLNYRMSELQAALGVVQTRRLPENLQRRASNFERLAGAIRPLSGLRILDGQTSRADNSHYCLVVVLDDSTRAQRNALVSALNTAGVGTSIYYPQPVPRMRYYREKYGYAAERYVEAERISDSSVALPVGPHLTADDLERIADHMTRLHKEILK
jgi:dTDP-4-amino-4,6-dideoxygalactose transaminase